MKTVLINEAGSYLLFSSKVIRQIQIRDSSNELKYKVNLSPSVPRKFDLVSGDRVLYPAEYVGFFEVLIDEEGSGGGGSGGAVNSVNGKTGDVVLTALDVGAYSKEEVDVRLGGLETNIDSLDGRVTTNENNIANNTSKIDENTDALTGLETDIGSLSSRVTINEGNITSNTSKIDQNTTALNSLEADIDSLSGRVTTNETNIAGNTIKIDETTTALGGLETDIDSLDSRVTTNETNITSNTSKIDENTTALTGLETDINSLDSRITTNASNIASNVSKIDENASLLNSNTARIDDNTAAIESLRDGINVTPGTTNITINNALPFGVYMPFDGPLEHIPQDFGVVDGSLHADADLAPELVTILNKRYNKEQILDEDGVTVIQEADPVDHTRLPDASNRVMRGVGSLISLGELQEEGLKSQEVWDKNSNQTGRFLIYDASDWETSGGESGGVNYIKRRQVKYGNLKTIPEKEILDEETRVKALGTYYITRLRNTIKNPIVEEVAKVKVLEAVNAGDALRIVSVDETTGQVLVNKLAANAPFEFIGLAQATVGANTETTMQLKGLAYFPFGSIGQDIYLKSDGTYSTDVNDSIYYIGHKATANEIYMADRIYVGTSAPYVKKLDNLTNTSSQALSSSVIENLVVPCSVLDFTGDLVTYTSISHIITILDTNSVYTFTLRAHSSLTSGNNINIMFYLTHSDTIDTGFTVYGTPITTVLRTNGTIDAVSGSIKGLKKYVKVMFRNLSNNTVTFNSTESTVGGQTVTLPAFSLTITN